MHGALEMALMGATTSVVAPLAVLLARRQLPPQVRLPPALSGAAFVLLHAGITMAMVFAGGAALAPLLFLLLLLGAIAFWRPVLVTPSRLGGAGRTVYLLLAAPSLDLAALVVIASGQEVAGLAMIVAMLPIGAVALALTWRWMVEEEREAAACAGSPSGLPASAAVPSLRRTGVVSTAASSPGAPAQRYSGAGGGRRAITSALGLLWLFDGALQMQPRLMSSAGLVHVILMAQMGVPRALVGPSIALSSAVVSHPVVADVSLGVFQLLLGAGILWRRTSRAALATSVPWALGVWVVGEGYGGLFGPGSSLLSGAPGPAILYGVVALAMLAPAGHPRPNRSLAQRPAADPGTGQASPDRRSSSPGDELCRGRERRGAQRGTLRRPMPGGALVSCARRLSPSGICAGAWAVLWCGTALLYLRGPFLDRASPAFLSSQLLASANGQPSWLASMDHALGAASAHIGPTVVASLALVQCAVGLGVLVPRLRQAALLSGSLLATVIWVGAENLGGLVRAGTTDPSSGPLIVLLAAAVACTSVPPRTARHRPALELRNARPALRATRASVYVE